MKTTGAAKQDSSELSHKASLLAQDLLSSSPLHSDQLTSLPLAYSIECILGWVVDVPDKPLTGDQTAAVGTFIDNVTMLHNSKPNIWDAIVQHEKWVMLESLFRQHEKMNFSVLAAASALSDQLPNPPPEAQGFIEVLTFCILDKVCADMSNIHTATHPEGLPPTTGIPLFMWSFSQATQSLDQLRRLLPSPSSDNLDPEIVSRLDEIQRLSPFVQGLVDTPENPEVANACSWLGSYLCLVELSHMTRHRTQGASLHSPKF